MLRNFALVNVYIPRFLSELEKGLSDFYRGQDFGGIKNIHFRFKKAKVCLSFSEMIQNLIQNSSYIDLQRSRFHC